MVDTQGKLYDERESKKKKKKKEGKKRIHGVMVTYVGRNSGGISYILMPSESEDVIWQIIKNCGVGADV